MLRLEAMYNKVAMAARVYQQAQESLDRALMMGVITADEQKAKLAEITAAYNKVGDSAQNAQAFINRFGENAQAAGRGLNQFGMVAQQVGYQVGDFSVQIQSGTNAFVAFGQQATQLARLIPGVAGAILGIGISVTTAFLAYKSRTNEAIEDTKRFEEALKSLQQQTQATKDQMLALASGFQSAQEGAILREIINLQVQASALRSQAQEEEGLVAQNLANQAVELERQIQARRKALEESKKASEDQKRLQDQYQEKLNRAYDTLFKTSKIDLGKVFSSASPLAEGLLKTVSDLYTKAVALAYIADNSAGGTSYLANQYALYGQGQQMSKQTLSEAGPLYQPFSVPEPAGTSGG